MAAGVHLHLDPTTGDAELTLRAQLFGELVNRAI